MLKLAPLARLALPLLIAVPLLTLGGCKSGGSTPPREPGGFGSACSDTEPCREPLACRAGVCEIDSTQSEGDPCTLSAQCMGALFCAEDRRCHPAGAGGEGSACDSSGDCAVSPTLLVCVPSAGGTVCTASGTVDVGGGCISDAQCLAGLMCVGIQCSDGTDGGTGGDGGMGGDAGGDSSIDSGRRDGGGDDSGRRDGSSPEAGPFPDAGLGTCDRASCDDSNPCTLEMCAGDMCVNRLVDFDHDGYASNQFDRSCGDCSDSEGDAHPGQTRWFGSTHRAGGDDPAGYDWNCDGTEEKQYTMTMGSCSGTSCSVRQGWQGGVPACGARAAWSRCNPDCTISVIEGSRQQGCR